MSASLQSRGICYCGHGSQQVFFFSSRRRHTRFKCDWSSDVCSSDLPCRRRWPGGSCLPAVGGALMRGQVDMILLAIFCGMVACALRGRSTLAGLLLAAAISIKVIDRKSVV